MRLFAPKRSLPVSLHLLEPTIYLEPTGDHPSVLRGVLNVSSKDFMARIKSVHLCIKGRLTTCSKEQRILDKQISCYRKAEKFAFELQLPIDLPDTITCSDIKVEYEVVASVIHGDSRKKNVITLKQPVRLARLPFKTLMLAGDNVTWIDSQPQSALDILEYRMLIEKRFLSLGSQFPLSIWIAPKVQGLRIVCISAQLIERRRIYGNTQRQHSHFLVRCMADPETLPQSDIDMPWQGTFQYKLPDDMVVPSSRYKRVYCIEHALQVSLLVTHPTGSDQRVHKSITFETDIDLLDQSVGALERSVQLPTYDNARPRRRPSELEKMASIICAPSPPIYDDVVRPPSYASSSVQFPPTAS